MNTGRGRATACSRAAVASDPCVLCHYNRCLSLAGSRGHSTANYQRRSGQWLICMLRENDGFEFFDWTTKKHEPVRGECPMSEPIPPNSRFRRRTISIMAGCVAAAAFVGVFFLAYSLLEAQTAPSGLVEEPQLLGVDTGDPAGQLFTYRGYTNFPG